VISTNSSIRTGLCEEVSSQPDFIRDLADMGFNLENCEVWFERAVIGVMTMTAVVIIVRVSHAILTLCLPSFSAPSLRTSALHLMPLSYDTGSFRDHHLQLLLPPLPLPVVVVVVIIINIIVVDRIYGVAPHELGVAPPYLFATHPIHLVVVPLSKRDVRGVRLFPGPAQQPVRGTGAGDAGRRGVDISHRTFHTVVPPTDPQTPSLWEGKPPCPVG